MRIVAIIQARMGSTRLPGKVLRDINGETMLSRVVQRVRQADLLNQIVVATTTEAADNPIVFECDNLNVAVFRGSEMDVLDRYYQASLAYESDAIVRITSDCPLIDPFLIDKVVRTFLNETPDYASNAVIRTYPRGLETEVMTQSALTRSWLEATKPYQRAHVTPYIYQNPRLFRMVPVQSTIDYSHHRWTVDTIEDLKLVQAIYSHFAKEHFFSWQEILNLLDREPDLQQLNEHVRQKNLEEG